MNRFNFLVLIVILEFNLLSAKADPVPNLRVDEVNGKPAYISGEKGPSGWSVEKRSGIPKDVPVGDFGKLPAKTVDRFLKTVRVKGQLLHARNKKQNGPNENTKKVIFSPIKSKKLDPHQVGDFGPLPTNSIKQNKTVHPSDFQTVPIESVLDTRKAK